MIISHSEFPQAAEVVRRASDNAKIFFRAISLAEPPKKEMMEFLDNEHAGASSITFPARKARVQAYIDRILYEDIVNLDTATTSSRTPLHGRHSYIDTDFMAQVAAACLVDPKIQQEIETLELPEEATVVVEPWAYATDGLKDMKDRWTMVRLLRTYRKFLQLTRSGLVLYAFV